MPPLKNARQEKFVQNLVRGMSQTEAYIQAGYSPKGAEGAASKLQGIAKVADRLAELQEQGADEAIADRNEVAKVLTSIIRAKHSDFMTMSADGVWFHDIGPETLSQPAIKKVKTRVVTSESGESVVQKQYDTVEMESKIAAAQALAKLMGYNAPDKVHTDVSLRDFVDNTPPPDDSDQ